MAKIHIKEILSNLYLLRVDDSETKYFEALWEIPNGITYNAYILKTPEGAVLFDGWKGSFSEEFIRAVKEVVDPKNIKKIVIHHMEPDHTGSLKALLKEVDNEVEVLGRPMVKNMIKSFYNVDVNFRSVKDLGEMEFGGYHLKFIATPWLHWPETMITYIKELKALLTCDVFGGYGIPNSVFDDEVDAEAYLDFVKEYLTTVIGSYKIHIVKNIDKIRKLNLDIGLIAPGHGLLWRKEPSRIIEYYYELAEGKVRKRKAVVIYDSMYGFVERAISRVEKVLEEEGVMLETFKFNDLERSRIAEALSEATDSSLIVLGISTYENDLFPLMKYFVELLVKKVNRDVPILIVSSYGWGPVVGTKVLNLLKESEFKIVDVLQFRGEAGKDFDEKVRRIVLETMKGLER